MPKREGREPAVNLAPEEWAEIHRISGEIMEAVMAGSIAHESGQHSIRRHIEIVLARNVTAAQRTYEAALATEEIHKPHSLDAPFGEHAISACSLDFCGRYAGQRRETFRDARGAVPRKPGSPRAEDVIRKLRDEPDPVVRQIVQKMYGDESQ